MEIKREAGAAIL